MWDTQQFFRQGGKDIALTPAQWGSCQNKGEWRRNELNIKSDGKNKKMCVKWKKKKVELWTVSTGLYGQRKEFQLLVCTLIALHVLILCISCCMQLMGVTVTQDIDKARLRTYLVFCCCDKKSHAVWGDLRSSKGILSEFPPDEAVVGLLHGASVTRSQWIYKVFYFRVHTQMEY